jgi:hypothetical protein
VRGGIVLDALAQRPCPLASAGTRVGVVEHLARAVQPERQQGVERGRDCREGHFAHRARRGIARCQPAPAPRLRERVNEALSRAGVCHPRHLPAIPCEHLQRRHRLAAEQLRNLARRRPERARRAVIVGQQHELADHLCSARQVARAHSREVIRVVDAKQHAALRVYRWEPV